MPNVRTVGGGGLCEYHYNVQRRGQDYADAERESARRQAAKEFKENRKREKRQEKRRKQKARSSRKEREEYSESKG
jgi:hypothetical protein